ncbi:MAG: terminase large subunit [Castellaniella sp.]|nr:terminase large subunit [Castellaniella sp.]
MEWSTACPDWADRLRAGESIIPPPIFPDYADQALEVFKALRIVDAPGSPTFGESCGQWVFDLVRSIFGAYDVESGRRLITEWFVLIPKKNSKSTIAAGIMMTALILNWRESAEFTILAPTIEVASNAFAPARDMVRKDEELDDLMQVQTHVRTITQQVNNATLKVVAADPNTVGGKKSVGTFADELWLFGKQSNAENMFREAFGGLASRPEGFVIYATTQSDDPPAGVFRQKLQYARDVRDGKIVDPRFVPVIYEFPQEMIDAKRHLDPKNFHIVNPNMGRSVDLEFLGREFTKARATGEESLRGFLAKHLNVEIGMNLRSDRWAGADHWEARGGKLALDDLLSRSEVVTIGIDGGGLDDLLGAAVIGREKETGRWLHWGKAWAHESVLERRKEIAPRLKDFERDGDLMIVKNVGDDVRDLADIIKMVYDRSLLPEKNAVGVDQIGLSFEEIFDDAEIPPELLVGVSQGYRLGGTIMTVERKLAEGSFIHGGRPMMAWCVSNCRVEQRSNSILITKQASGKAKIDPVMALLDAAQLMAMNPAPTGKKYEMFFL